MDWYAVKVAPITIEAHTNITTQRQRRYDGATAPWAAEDTGRNARVQGKGRIVKDQKVLGIGFHKTGTSTFKSAVSLLGYSFAPRFEVSGQIEDTVLVSRALEIAATVDAVQDNPWPLLFRELDDAFPGSKFVLTIRDTDEWWVSLVHHFGGRSTEMRNWIYGEGDPTGHEALYKERYEAHNAAVIEYFGDRPEDLFVFAITDGEGWTELCQFLGEAVPDTPFPHRRPHRNDRFGSKLAQRLLGRFSRT